MAKIICNIEDIININEINYFIVRPNSESKKYNLRKDKFSKYDIQVGQNYYFSKIFNQSSKSYQFEFIGPVKISI